MVFKVTAAALLVLSLTACGSSDSSKGDDTPKADPTATASSTDLSTIPVKQLPTCTEIWIAKAILPADYAGCNDSGNREFEQATTCKDGSRLVVSDERFYAITGQKIVETDVAPLEDTEEFGAIYSECTGK